MTYDVEDLTPCEHCGKPPLICEDERGDKIRVDACFEGALLGGIHVSGCCGHGGRKPTYVRLRTQAPDGKTKYIDLCGFRVQPLLSYTNPRAKYDDSLTYEEKYPPLNVERPSSMSCPQSDERALEGWSRFLHALYPGDKDAA